MFKLIYFALCLTFIFPSCVAQPKTTAHLMKPDELRAFLIKAQENKQDLRIRVNIGKLSSSQNIPTNNLQTAVYRGKITRIDERGFWIKDAFGFRDNIHNITYDQIIAIRPRNQLLKSLRNTGEAIGTGALIIVTLPLALLWIGYEP